MTPEDDVGGALICILAPFAHRAGHYGTIASSLQRALRQRGLAVSLLSAAGVAGIVDEGPAFGRILRLLARRCTSASGVRMTQCLEVATVMWKARKVRHPKGVVYHFSDATFLLLGLWLWLKDAPTVYYLPGSMEALVAGVTSGRRFKRIGAQAKQWLLQRAARRGRLAIVCETDHLRTSIEQVVGPIAHVVPYAVEPAPKMPDKESARQKLQIPHGMIVVLLFGTHREGKNYETVVDAACADASLFLLFVGALISANDPEALARERKLQRVKFVSRFVSDDEVSTFFAAADVVALPYEGDFNRGSGVLVEACRYERVLVVADTGHLREFVQKYDCGVVYRQGDAQAFARALHEAVSPSREADFKAGLRRAAKEHSWTSACDRYIAIYRRVLRLVSG